MSQWEFVVDWCDLLQLLISKKAEDAVDVQSLVALSLIKSDSLIQQKKFEDAVHCSEKLRSWHQSPRSLEMLFKALLHFHQPVDIAVTRFMEILSIEADSSSNIALQCSQEEFLSRIVFCIGITHGSLMLCKSDRDRATRLLLKQWLQWYRLRNIWKFICTSEEDVGSSSKSHNHEGGIFYFAAARDVAQLFLLYHLHQPTTLTKAASPIKISSMNRPIPSSECKFEANESESEAQKLVVADIIPEVVKQLDSYEECVPVECHNDGGPIDCDQNLSMKMDKTDDLTLLEDGVQKSILSASLQPIPNDQSESSTLMNKAGQDNSFPNNLSEYFFVGGNVTEFSAHDVGEKCYFTCSLQELNSEVLGLLTDLSKLISEIQGQQGIGFIFKHLGEMSDISWLSVLAWNVGKILLTSNNATTSTNGSSSDSRFLSGAQYFEVAEELFSFIPPEADETIQLSRCMCLVVAAAARLDFSTTEPETSYGASVEALTHRTFSVDSQPDDSENVGCSPRHKRARILPASEEGVNVEGSSTFLSENVWQALRNVQKAESILQQQSDFEDDNDNSSTLRKQLVLIQFSCLCKLKEHKRCKKFVQDKETIFLGMNCEELSTCADIARLENGGSHELCRSMLLYAIQVGARVQDSRDVISFMTQVYCKLIELCPSRQSALEKVEEFEQWINSLGEGIANKSECRH